MKNYKGQALRIEIEAVLVFLYIYCINFVSVRNRASFRFSQNSVCGRMAADNSGFGIPLLN